MSEFDLPSWLKGPLRNHGFPGGITPPARKADALRSRIMPMPLAPVFSLPLTHYKSARSKPCVSVGDEVLKYQLLATATDTGSVPVHAPTSGRITAIHEAPIAGRVDMQGLCIELTADGEDTALALQPEPDYRQLDPGQLLARIAVAGISGMGGAGFPTAEKLRLAAAQSCELLIINAVECEPYISADQALMRERAAEVVAGADIARAASTASRCVIALKNDMHDAIAATRAALAHSPIELVLVDNKYPAGAEQTLIQAVTGMQVPTGRHPTASGILMINAGTAYACGQAVIAGRPCISRITTLTGDALLTPKNFEALIGTPLSFLFTLCGVDETRHTRTILGGPLMGIELQNTEVPLTQMTNCLIAATAEEFPAPAPEQPCIRCGDCADVCPVKLLPQQLYGFARSHAHGDLLNHGLFDCIECGACEYACPSHIPLVQYYRASKDELHETARQRVQAESWRTRFQHHQARIRRDKDRARERRRPDLITSTSPAPTTQPAPFSREQAQQEIAAAVARIRAKQAALKNGTDNGGEI